MLSCLERSGQGSWMTSGRRVFQRKFQLWGTSPRNIRRYFAMGRTSPHPRASRGASTQLPSLNALQLEEDSAETRTVLILELLRRTAMQNQNEHPRPFYSIREVADHFRMPPTTVGRVYERLRSDGLLRTIWGSKTILEPIASIKTGEAKKIGIVIDLSRFTSSLDYRRSILDLQQELWNQSINERLLFFQDRDEEILHLCKRHRSDNVSTVIWLLAEASNKKTILRLNDAGFQVICFTDTTISGLRDCYPLAADRAIGKILRETIRTV